MLKSEIEKVVKYYDVSKRENVERLTNPLLRSLLIETEQDEINRLQAILEKIEKTIEFVERITKNTIKELRSHSRELR